MKDEGYHESMVKVIFTGWLILYYLIRYLCEKDRQTFELSQVYFAGCAKVQDGLLKT